MWERREKSLYKYWRKAFNINEKQMMVKSRSQLQTKRTKIIYLKSWPDLVPKKIRKKIRKILGKNFGAIWAVRVNIFLLCQTFNLLIKFFKYSVTVTYLCTICMAIKNTLPDLSSWVVNQPHKVMSLESKKLKKYYIW